MTSRDCRYAITDVNTSKETTCRPDRRQTLLLQTNLPFVPLRHRLLQQFQVLCKWYHYRFHANNLLQPLYLLRHVAPPVKHTSNEAAELIHLQLLLAKPLWTCTSYTIPTRRYLYRCWPLTSHYPQPATQTARRQHVWKTTV